MAFTVPTTEPASLRAGDTWAWTRGDLSDYPASTWTLTYYFRNATSHFNVSATADGDSFAVEVLPATTAAIVPGWYEWFAFVSDGTDRHQVATGRSEVLQDVTNAVPFDGRSWARRMLDYVEAALESRASTDQLDLVMAQLDQRTLTRDKGGLITLRSMLQADVRREEQATTGYKGGRLLVRFG